jgi:serine protease Do
MKRSKYRYCCALLAALFLSSANSSSASLVETVHKIKPAIILVGTFSALNSPRFSFRGTGFVVGDENFAITNAHVLPEYVEGTVSRQVAVQVWNSVDRWSLRMANIVDRDEVHDIALLKIEGSRVLGLSLDRSSVKEGASIAFMGFPIGGVLGYSHVTHRGIISSIAPMTLPSPHSAHLSAKALLQLRNGTFDAYQLDATAYPGNSGGPIFDPESGAVIGVINSVLVKSGRESALSQPTGISYGIPIRHVHEMLVRARESP